jgi:hypothetical protein
VWGPAGQAPIAYLRDHHDPGLWEKVPEKKTSPIRKIVVMMSSYGAKGGWCRLWSRGWAHQSMVVHTHNPSFQKAEAGGLRVRGQLGKGREGKETKERRKEKRG